MWWWTPEGDMDTCFVIEQCGHRPVYGRTFVPGSVGHLGTQHPAATWTEPGAFSKSGWLPAVGGPLPGPSCWGHWRRPTLQALCTGALFLLVPAGLGPLPLPSTLAKALSLALFSVIRGQDRRPDKPQATSSVDGSLLLVGLVFRPPGHVQWEAPVWPGLRGTVQTSAGQSVLQSA